MNSKGFTLLETIAAISILIGGVLIVYASSARMLAYTYDNQYKLTASYLAQEGIEVIRNIRDQNWVEGAEEWADGLSAGDWRVQYDSTSLMVYADTPLLLSEDGFYSYDSGESTVFKRKITISQLSDDSLKVIAEVSWPYDQGRSVQAEKILYNWF
jgi:hypothetical protein